MTSVELIYDADCPNAPAARAQLLRAFAASKLAPRWQEWERSACGNPHYVRDYGSPTVLVNGRDVSPETHTQGADRCRIYSDDEGLARVPPVAAITSALRATHALRQSRMSAAFTALPAVGFALLPKLTCPACWPAYAGLLTALGSGFVDYTPYLLPLTALFLAVTLVSLGYRAKRRHGYRPLWLGVVATLIVIAGKFWFDSNLALYSGIALLVATSLWNSWPARALKHC